LNTQNSVTIANRVHVNITYFIQNEFIYHLLQFVPFLPGHSVYYRQKLLHVFNSWLHYCKLHSRRLKTAERSTSQEETFSNVSLPILHTSLALMFIYCRCNSTVTNHTTDTTLHRMNGGVEWVTILLHVWKALDTALQAIARIVPYIRP
jgi:hypothetical protein